MTQAAETFPPGVLTDEAWFETVLDRLEECLTNQDALGRLRIIRESKRQRPHLAAWFVGIEFMCPHVDGANAARRTAQEIAEKSRVTNNINMAVNGDLNAASGAVVGIDVSAEKTIGSGDGEAA